MMDRHRVKGKVVSVSPPHNNDHGGLTTWVHLVFDDGNQGFGGLILDKQLAVDYVNDMCSALGVGSMEEMVGQEYYVLYSFGRYNEPIEGLESVTTGKRFLHNVWRKKYFPKTQSVFEQEYDRIHGMIEWAKRRVNEEQHKIVNLKKEYVDWETAK